MDRLVKMYRIDDVKATVRKRVLEGHASIFNTVDLQGDVVQPGAFAKQISELKEAGRIGDVKLLWQHWPDNPIGKCVDIGEDETGLWFKAQVSEVPDGDRALVLIADGVIDKMSFGFDVLKSHKIENIPPVEIMPGLSVTPQSLDELKIYEVSPVTFPAHTGTDVALAKGIGVPLWKNDQGRWTPERGEVERLLDTSEKIGQVLSAKNRERLTGAIAAVNAARAKMVEVLASAATEDPADKALTVQDARMKDQQRALLTAALKKAVDTIGNRR